LIDQSPRAPVTLHFGETDASIPLDDVRALSARHPGLPLHLYSAGHGFSCEARGSFDLASHELALDRTREFLLENLDAAQDQSSRHSA
jgi:carboxymethylenebutenolidase